MEDSSDAFFNNFNSSHSNSLQLKNEKSSSSSSYYNAAPGGTGSNNRYYDGAGSSNTESEQAPDVSSSSYYGSGMDITTTNNSSNPTTKHNTTRSNYDAYGGNTNGSHTTTTTPQIMNPYVLSSTGDTATKTTMQQQDTTGLSGAMDSNNNLSGSMDSNYSQKQQKPGSQSIKTTTFIPKANTINIPASPSSGGFVQPYDPTEFDNEPPLLEELGINVEHIFQKMRNVILPFERFGGKNMDATVIQDADLSGPVALALLLGGELLLTDGKLSFGYIYGVFLFGCVSMTFILNFMSPQDAISFWTVTSILGYSLLPVNILAAVKLIVVKLANFITIGRVLAFLTVLWCTVSSTRLMEQGCDMRNQRYLIAYPIALLYTAFVMITIF